MATSQTETVTSESAERAPRLVRLAVTGVLAALLAGAAWLVAVRGEAILVDLAQLGSRVWCF